MAHPSQSIACPFCGLILIDLHPNKVYCVCGNYKIELSCHNPKCSFGNHYKTIPRKEAEDRLKGDKEDDN